MPFTHLPGSCLALVLALAIAVALAACAAPVDVRSVGAVAAAPAYELRGPRLAALDLQVRALCPQGHEVVRQSERLHRQTADSNFMRRGIGWLQRASGFIEDETAQLLVQCKAVPEVPMPSTPASAPAA